MENSITNPTEAQSDSSAYEGSWEGSNRSPVAAAVLGLLGIGVLYFNVQSFLAMIVILVSSRFKPLPASSDNILTNVVHYVERYKLEIQVVVFVTQFLFMLLPTLWLVRRWHTTEVRKYVRFRPAQLREVGLAVLGTLALIPTSAYVAHALAHSLHIPRELQEVNEQLFTSSSLPEFFWLVLVIAITPAICEETFFRGYVQRTMERTVKWKSVLIVGVVFGLFHLQPLGLISLSILGMVFGYFAYRSKSLLPSMAAHFTNNFVVILFSFIEAKSQVDRSTMEQISLSWVIATFAIGVIILYTFQKITDRNFSEEYAPTVVE